MCVKSLNFAYYGLSFSEKEVLQGLPQLEELVVHDLRAQEHLNDRHWPEPNGRPYITQEVLQCIQQVPNHYARWTWWKVDPMIPDDDFVKHNTLVSLVRKHGGTGALEGNVFDCSLHQGH